MYEYLHVFESLINSGRKAILDNLLSRASKGEYPLTVEQVTAESAKGILTPSYEFDEDVPIWSISGYNTSNTRIASDIGGLFEETKSLERLLTQISRIHREELDTISRSLSDIESKIQSGNGIDVELHPFTSVVTESFDIGDRSEQDLRYYQEGAIDRALVDKNDGQLKLPLRGDFTTVDFDSKLDSWVDRLYGLPMTEDHTPSESVDGFISTFWMETLHSKVPLTERPSWCPSSYKGGAAVRLCVQFDCPTRVSELDISPFGAHPIRCLNVGYVLGESNIISDLDTWVASGTAVLSEDTIYVTSSTSEDTSYFYSPADIVVTGSVLEVSCLSKSVTTTPLLIGVTFYTTSGTPILDKEERFFADSPDWTNLVYTFDYPDNAYYARVRLGVHGHRQVAEAYFKDISCVDVSFVEVDHLLDREDTIYLEASVIVRRIYLTLSQEHGSWRHYSIQDWMPSINRLSRPRAGDRLSRYQDRLLRAHKVPLNRTDVSQDLRDAETKGWEALNNLEEAIEDLPIRDVAAVEYIIGAYQIVPRHREYAPSARYVSKPINLRREIREIRLQADARDTVGSIRYLIAHHDGDTPEQAHEIGNISDVGSSPERLRYLPLVESAARNPGTGDILVTVHHKTERFVGTDRNGIIELSKFPYTNNEKIADLTALMSNNLSGIDATYDPNSIEPQYQNFEGDTTTTQGYRPIEVSIFFEDGVKALPDILGMPVPDQVRFIQDETLVLTDSQIKWENESNTTNGVRTNTTVRGTTTYSTRFRNIAVGLVGVPVSLRWISESLSPVDIDPKNIQVNALQGLVQVLEGPPSETYTSIEADYWIEVGESGDRTDFFVDTLFARTQAYPVTRNRTNYLTGEVPILNKADTDPLSQDYYPVYEYYVTEDAKIVFSQDFHKFGDTPARISVEYDTLDINPRVIMELTRPDQTSQTPSVDSYRLLLNLK
jgi:hypothetical protein